MDASADKKPGPMIVRLSTPIKFGDEMIEELVLKPVSRAFKDFELPMEEGAEGVKLVFQPYKCAIVGLKMSGHVVDATKLVDMLDPKDLVKLASAVFGFFV
jgi:hypothetical protein